jgi:antitoxin ParD1/3/4
MRTNIVINDELMQQVMQGGQFQTKKEAVEEGLRLLARQDTFRRILALRGKLELLDEPAQSSQKLRADSNSMESAIKTRVRSGKNKKRQKGAAA